MTLLLSYINMVGTLDKFSKKIKQIILDIHLEYTVSENVCDCLSNSNYTNIVDPHHKHVFTENLHTI